METLFWFLSKGFLFMIVAALLMMFGCGAVLVGRILIRLTECTAEIIDKWFGVSNNERPRPQRPTQPPSQPPDWR